MTNQFKFIEDSGLQIVPEITPGGEHYSMFNTGSTEQEVGEFLYSLVRVLKPERISETGTHAGISAAYMGQALKDNGRGFLTTLEVIPEWVTRSRELWVKLGLDNYISCVQASSLVYSFNYQIDLLFLDSEPQLRFDEFVRFWPDVRPGGFILIHDLHASLGHSGKTVNGQYDWPFGDFREKIGPYIKNPSVQIISFPSPRGFTLFQKSADNMHYINYILGRDIG